MPNAKQSQAHPSPQTGRFAYEGLDRVIHERARLGIMTSLLASSAGLSFTDLKELCGLTDGNLNRHLDVLSEAKLVEVRKDNRQRRTRTVCRLTAAGRTRFEDYLAELERVVTDAAQVAETAKSTSNKARYGFSAG